MKTIRHLFYGIFFLAIPFLVEAQSPDVFGFQQVIRDTAGYLIRNQPVSVHVSVLQGSVNGTVVYSETHTPMTNGNALATLNVGQGITVTGAFEDIDWHNGPFFIKTEPTPQAATTATSST